MPSLLPMEKLGFFEPEFSVAWNVGQKWKFTFG
jgi:hypothetical protein